MLIPDTLSFTTFSYHIYTSYTHKDTQEHPSPMNCIVGVSVTNGYT